MSRQSYFRVPAVLLMSVLLAACAPGPGTTSTPTSVSSLPPAQEATPTPVVRPSSSPAALGAPSTSPAAPRTPSPSPTAPRTPSPEQPVYGGILSTVNRDDPQSLDTIRIQSTTLMHVIAPIYNGLVQFDPEDPFKKLAPDLATEWNFGENGKQVTFTIRQGVRWHDGRSFDVEDARFTLDRIVHPPKGVVSIRSALFQSVSKVEAPNDRTIRLTLSQADATLMNSLAHPASSVLPKAIIEKNGDTSKVAIGTGPFKFKVFQPGVRFEVEKNPEYFIKGRPFLDGIVFYIVPEQSTQFAAFRAGRIQITGIGSGNWVTEEQARIVEQQLLTARLFSVGTGQIKALGFNVAIPPWTDVRVRKAVQLAIDRDSAIKNLYGGRGYVSTMIPPGFLGALSDQEMRQLPGYRQPKDQDLVEARKLMAAAGFPDGFTTEMIARSDIDKEVAEVLERELAKLKIRTNVRILTPAAFRQRLIDAQFELNAHSQAAFTGEPLSIFAAYVAGSDQNYSNLKDPAYDSVYTQQLAILDVAKRGDALKKLDDYLLGNAIQAPIGGSPGLRSASKNVRGWYQERGDFFMFLRHEDTWLAK